MSAYSWPALFALWKVDDLTNEQAIGHMISSGLA